MLLNPGTLYVVATPIGNLEDVTYRAVRVLGSVDLIAAEDTRHAAKLLARYEVTTPRTSLHEHNEAEKTGRLLARLARGETVALVSDAGTPLVSDPGARLVRAARERGLRVEAVPGPSAVLAALVSSGLAGGSFTFGGFPPFRSSARTRWFAGLAREARPFVFFEAPHRIDASLRDLEAAAGDRAIAVCRELTKRHEELVAGPVSDVRARLSKPRGEFTVVVEAAPEVERERAATPERAAATAAAGEPAAAALTDEVGRLLRQGVTRTAAVRAVASRFGVPRREVYQAGLRAEPQSGDQAKPQGGDRAEPQGGDHAEPQSGDHAKPQSGGGTASPDGDSSAAATRRLTDARRGGE